MGKVPKLKLQVLKVRNIVIILSKLVNGIKLRIEVYKISVIFEKAECTMTFLTIKMRM